MKVSNSVRKQYHNTSIHKNLLLYFPELDLEIRNSQIYEESMYLRESILEKKSIEFVGCISSIFMIDVNGLKDDVKGKEIVVSITTDDTMDEPIRLFNGIVDSAVRQDNKWIKKITAYDYLYTIGNTDVAAWYKSLIFPATIKQIRDSLFEYIGLTQVETDLPNDNITIKKQYDPKTLQALQVIKSICQINGAFGIVNRQGLFEYRILGDISTGLYPGFYPGANAFPGISASALKLDEISAEEFPFYRTVESEEFKVKPVDKITIRQSEDEDGVTYGDGDNNYIIQGNIFAYGLSSDTLLTVAENIYPNVQGFSYYPFRSENSGLPYLECGLDAASYMMIDWEETENSGDIVYKQESFYILNRELTGIQALKDSYSAKGEEYQSEFITDLQTQIDILKKKKPSGGVSRQEMEDYAYDREAIDNMFEKFEGGGGGGGGGGIANIVSVDLLPANPDENTLYLIRGEVLVG